jgi:hypothetical protein
VKKPFSGRKLDRSMTLTIAAAVAIVAAAVVIVCLYRFTSVFVSTPSEKRIARDLDFNDSHWAEELMELNLPSYQKDFSIYSAFSYTGVFCNLTLVYASRAKLDDIRSHYRALLENPESSGRNDGGVLNLRGKIRGRDVTIGNYFSEVSNLIQVNMEMTGEYALVIREKIVAAFPENALVVVPEIAAFASGESIEGYVMYDYNDYASDIYANVPLFSRAYVFDGTQEELREKINSLGQRYRNPVAASISEGIAEIKSGAYLYQIKPLEEGSTTKVALIIQSIPKS